MKKILVTGGAGYVGSHACKVLAQSGIEPIVFDNLSRGNPGAVKWGPLEIGDILDSDRLDEVLTKYRPDAIMHFAAYAYVGESVGDPETYYVNNVTGSLQLIKAMRHHDINKIIFSSSCSTYGMPQALAIDEMHLQIPVNPYGMTKLTIEACLRDFGVAYGLQSVVLRYFNAAGADPDGEIGEKHDPETHLIPLAIDAAIGRRGELTIHGDDYDTIDGTCVRDFVHVTDLANAHVQALGAFQSGNSFNAFNFF